MSGFFEALPACPGGQCHFLRLDRGEVRLSRCRLFPGVELCRREICAEAFREPCPPEDRSLVLHQCLEGRMEYGSRRRVSLTPGELWVGPGRAWPEVCRCPTGRCLTLRVVVCPREAPECLSCLLEDVEVSPAQLLERLCPGGAPAVTRAVPRLEGAPPDLPPGLLRGYWRLKVLELLLCLAALPPGSLSGPQGCSASRMRLAQRARRYLDDTPDPPATLEALADALGASPGQVRQSFRALYGRTPAAYLRERRMRQAAALLTGTDRTVLDIAGAVGYDNASKFARAFRETVGMTPREYRSRPLPEQS